ncbi:hypothetical protein K503DRAFT_804439 [Rhizopogon vinicolor AM-OR11-026]|uniref:G domain-containing protein n=1 Tax=Rhizopogon vinicolor AM-OR11-026 TaxID=1314800 RepID=A0A1B7ML69_9AGAM|nr:hypothetical protein K503DRAFT_804439 [Rhizopogon vinicolor AM-OR11-026]
MSTRNIVLFGQSGAGKSSVINLMAGGGIAETSNSANHCTMHWKEHPIAFGGYNYEVFDTIGLEEPQLGIDGYLEAIKNAHNLITKLDNEGGIDLLLFCVRAGRITATVQNNYRLFHEFLCEKKVPIVLVLTGLERELENMEDWWDKNMQTFHKYNISVAGHACITSAENLEGRSQQLYEESRQLERALKLSQNGQQAVCEGNLPVSRVLYRRSELERIPIGKSNGLVEKTKLAAGRFARVFLL